MNPGLAKDIVHVKRLSPLLQSRGSPYIEPRTKLRSAPERWPVADNLIRGTGSRPAGRDGRTAKQRPKPKSSLFGGLH